MYPTFNRGLIMTTEHGEVLEFSKQDKAGKKQIISFIRKVYSGTSFRDIYTGLHKAILKDGKLNAVTTDLGMITRYNEKYN